MRRTLLAMVLIFCSTPAFCQTTGTRLITMIRTGWNGDYFALVTAEDSENPDQLMNPAHCPTKDGYVSTSTSPGYSTYYAAALTAYSLGQSAEIIVADTNGSCALGRPMLIGINLGTVPSPVVSGGGGGGGGTTSTCTPPATCCGTPLGGGLCQGECKPNCHPQ
jgi:hypothetical protein